MKQLNLQKLQSNLRKKFLKLGVKMIDPETIFFSKNTAWFKLSRLYNLH